MAGLPSAYDCISMQHSSASGKQVLSRLEWALEDEAGQDAGFPLPSPVGWSAEKSLGQAAGQPHTWPAAGRAPEAAWVGSEGLPPDAPVQCFCLFRAFPEGWSWLVCQVLPVQVIPDREVRVFFPSRRSRACLCLQWAMTMVLQRLLPVQSLWDGSWVPQLGVSVSTSLGMGLLAQDTVALVSCQTWAGICSGLHSPQKGILKAPTIF